MQNIKQRKPYLQVHFQPLTERLERKKQAQMKNVLLRNVHAPRVKRSFSLPHNQRFLYRFETQPKNVHPSRKETNEDLQTREQSPQKRGSLATNAKQSQKLIEVKEKQQRKSCDCSLCGKGTIFQRDSMKEGVFIIQQIKEQEALANKFQRTQKKQHEKLYPQYMNMKSIQIEEGGEPNNDFIINSFEHLEDIAPQTCSNQAKCKSSFFDSFLIKQQQIVVDQRRKFSNHRKIFDKYRSIPFLPNDFQKVLTPRTPATMTTTLAPSPRKIKANVQMYLKPLKKPQKQHNRLLTLPEFRQII
ncbi:unnamed protein product (macronuclear) [Paramecium tetraurelia]|uniref:TPX2 C-terminal domain-containing protein n=1 Tax=Paramecium tetraurelia TaxID=5888 RepID=A0BYL6_PARTE|nr:uncharacterized protein GSPATT00033486001 [Paramecium tetraurelia]CAK63633.1 unnamed protein product [Paramecium tetraurelia]|eukprot:XP_001431031.1 hypothetical protein (macronuclear) [Paramecium tetraurelia strain d4-2]